MTTALETAALRLEFDRAAGGLIAITNKLTGETYAVSGDAFAVETTAFRRAQAEMRQVAWSATAEAVTARYADADIEVEVTYELRPVDHFFQKRLAVTFAAAGGVNAENFRQRRQLPPRPTLLATGQLGYHRSRQAARM